MKLILILAILLGLAVASGALLVAGSGLIPIKASSGHFAITEWFLQFSKQRSVATHTIGLELPPLDDPSLVLRGAGHYETACKPCHGAPDLQNPRIPAAMLPPPPALAERIRNWEPEELFYIVKHGIKFTGMPAWPTQQRDDEVQAMVAFLLEYPSLDAGEYRRLVHGEDERVSLTSAAAPLIPLAGEPPPPRAVTSSCARCHGVSGAGRGLGAFPRLAGQRAEYLHNALVAYAKGSRHSGVMEPVVGALQPRELRELADYYAALPPRPPARAPASDPQLVERGRALAARGVPEDNIPACADCHGPEPKRHNLAYPHLAGQYREYLALQLNLLREGRRGGSQYAHVMHKAVEHMTPEQVEALAAYYSSLPWTGRASE